MKKVSSVRMLKMENLSITGYVKEDTSSLLGKVHILKFKFPQKLHEKFVASGFFANRRNFDVCNEKQGWILIKIINLPFKDCVALWKDYSNMYDGKAKEL